MIWPCPLYNFDPASIDGVGRALHATPPGMCVYRGALQPAEPCELRIIAPHLRDFSDYDVQACSWLHMQSFIRNFAFHGCAQVDITAGAHYPWWLCMASPGRMRASIPVGVHRVAVCLHHSFPCVVMENHIGSFRIFDASLDPTDLRHLCIQRFE